MGRPREGVHHTPGAISTGAALVLLLVTRSSTKPVNFLHIGHECNLPVSRRRLQRYVNRAAQETKIGFYQQVDNDMATATDLTTRDMQDCWDKSLLGTVSWSILPSFTYISGIQSWWSQPVGQRYIWVWPKHSRDSFHSICQIFTYP